MKRWVLVVLFALFLLSISAIGLSCASRVVIIGGGSNVVREPLPTVDTKSPSHPNPLDPSQYEHPNLPTSPHNPSTSSSSTNSYTNASSSPSLRFSMTSWVAGSSIDSSSRGAGFSEWKYLNDGDDFKAKLTSSALYGNLDESRVIRFSKDQQASDTLNETTAVMLLQDQIKFLGNFYNELGIYSNNGDVVRNSFTAGAISKNSTYYGGFDDYRMTDENETGHFRKSTIYNLDSRSVGIANLALISESKNDTYEISEQYSGSIALAIKFKNDLNVTYDREKDEWLPCCNSGLADMQGQDRQYYNASKIFDCTCIQPPAT